MVQVVLITDGSAHNVDRSGGWACVIRTPNSVIERSGWATDTTSNRMEMTAAIEGLSTIKVPSNISLVSDSAYVLNSIRNKWYERWFKEEEDGRNHRRPNIDLWHQIAGLVAFHTVTPFKIKGHSGDYWNERVDKLASLARKQKMEMKTMLPNFEGDSWHGGYLGTDGFATTQSYPLLST